MTFCWKHKTFDDWKDQIKKNIDFKIEPKQQQQQCVQINHISFSDGNRFFFLKKKRKETWDNRLDVIKNQMPVVIQE